MNFAILTQERNQKINIKHIQRKHPASFNYLRAQSTQNKNSSKNKLPTKWLGLQFEEKKIINTHRMIEKKNIKQ